MNREVMNLVLTQAAGYIAIQERKRKAKVPTPPAGIERLLQQAGLDENPDAIAGAICALADVTFNLAIMMTEQSPIARTDPEVDKAMAIVAMSAGGNARRLGALLRLQEVSQINDLAAEIMHGLQEEN